MPYVVLGLGMLVSIIGAYAMYSGFRIIEIERGWATAIVGSVLFSGGLVTMTLGLAIRTMEKVKTALGARPVPAVDTIVEAGQQEAAPSAPTAPIANESHSSGAVLAAASGTLAEMPDGVAEEQAAPPTPAPQPRRILADSLPRDAQDLASPGTDDEFFAEASRHRETARSADPTPLEPEEPPVSRASDLEDGEKPRQQAAVVTPVEEPAMDSWLDESFAELDARESPAPHATRAAADSIDFDDTRHDADAAGDPVIDHRTGSTTADEHRDDVSVPDAPSPPRTEQEAAPQPAVIGRYESEGTSYVMYADGSIEAQSDAGVYRFASMAELKAFIET